MPLLFVGCTVKQLPPVHTYGIDPAPVVSEEAVTQKLVFDSLDLNVLGTMQTTNTNGIYYRKSDHEEAPYAYSRWNNTPRSMLLTKMLATLLQANLGRNVSGPLSKVKSSRLLEITILDFVHEYDENGSYAVVVLNNRLIDRSDDKVLSSREIRIRKKAETDNAQGGVTAMNLAVSEAVASTVSWLKFQAPSGLRSPKLTGD